MKPLSLLIVDDNNAECILMGKLTRSAFADAHVVTETDPEAAIALCAGEQFDCVILDYSMPQMDGLTCAKKMRDAFPDLAIVLSTRYGDEMLAAEALRNGVTDYIPKSRVTAQSLSRVVQNAIQLTRQNQLIKEQRVELEQFGYALAHDFKQPVRQMRTFAQLVREAVRDGRTEDLYQHLDFIDSAAARLGNLVDVMSQYTLLSQAPQIDDIDLNPVLENVRLSLGSYVQERCGRVTIEQVPTVRGNEALMVQVLQNLIVNGLKYNKSAEPSVHISAHAAGRHCLLTVRDNGIGIESQYLEEIFKPLARLHPKSEYSGTGLGLTLARKAVTAMGGTIVCNSRPGAGTEFVVRLDLATADAERSKNVA